MRRKVAVIVDAPAAVPQDLVEKLDIGIVPLHAVIDGRDYLETEVEWNGFSPGCAEGRCSHQFGSIHRRGP
jgi:hypothetical protein